MGAFLCFMAVRLLETHRILKDTGSIFLHCDPTASHYLKELMDAIFGKNNFINEIIWYYKNASRGKTQFAKAHDIIFWYSKTSDYVFNRDDVLVPYESGMTEWRYRKAGKEPPKGKTPDDVIVMPSLNTMAKERTGHPTQKPLELYKQFIEAASNKGGMVLDPFCGCATTCVAAEQLSREWVGIDLWKRAHEVVWDRLREECMLIDPEGKSEGLAALLNPGDTINYQTKPPICTDEQKEAVPFLPSKNVKYEPETLGERMGKAEMKQALLQQNGAICEGCHRQFDDERYLELDHKNPRSNGGANSLYNRILLCSPCNKMKSNKITLVELVRLNKKSGFWKEL